MLIKSEFYWDDGIMRKNKDSGDTSLLLSLLLAFGLAKSGNNKQTAAKTSKSAVPLWASMAAIALCVIAFAVILNMDMSQDATRLLCGVLLIGASIGGYLLMANAQQK